MFNEYSEKLEFGSCFLFNTNEFIHIILLKILNCTSHSNSAGLVFLENLPNSFSNPQILIDFSEFHNNIVSYEEIYKSGASIFLDIDSNMTINNSNFKNNILKTENKTLISGGACINSFSEKNTLTIVNSLFINNHAIYYGNCIYFIGKYLDLKNSTFEKNKNFIPKFYFEKILFLGYGGVIFSSAQYISISNCRFNYNKNKYGGVIFFSLNKKSLSNIINISESIFQENHSDLEGGVFYFPSNFYIFSLNIYFCSFKGNFAKTTGGVFYTLFYSYQLFMIIKQSNFTENFATDAGVFYSNNILANISLINCRINNNKVLLISRKNAKNTFEAGVVWFDGKARSYFYFIGCEINENFAETEAAFFYSMQSGYCTVQNSIFKNNFALKYPLYSRRFFTVSIIQNTIFIDNFAFDKNELIFIYEFPTFTLSGSIFKNINNLVPCSVIKVQNNGNYNILNNYFFGFNSVRGGIITIQNLKLGKITILNNKIENCSTTDSFFQFFNSISITFSNGSFINNIGQNFKAIQKSQIKIIQTTILDSSCLNQIGCFSYFSSNSLINIQDLMIINITSLYQPGLMYIENVGINISNFKSLNSYCSNGFACFQISNSDINIFNSYFFNFTFGCIYAEASSIKIETSFFSNENNFFYDQKFSGNIIQCLKCLLLNINSSKFLGNVNNSLDGGVINFKDDFYISSPIKFNFIINNSFFFNNSVRMNGGALYIMNSFVFIQNSIFFLNNASSGGGIYFSKEYLKDQSDFTIYNSTFLANKAILEGGAIKITGMFIKSKNCSYVNNSAIYGDNIAAYPIKMKLQNNNLVISNKTNNYLIVNQVTGLSLTSPIEINLIDFFGQRLNLILEELIQITICDIEEIAQIGLLGKDSSIIDQGKFIYDNFSIKSDPPNATIIFSFSSVVIDKNYLINLSETKINELKNNDFPPDIAYNIGDKQINNKYIYELDIELRSCRQGEVYNQLLKTCIQCPFKTFSFNPKDSMCLDCPENTICYGGDNITILPGYWRSSNISIEIHSCTPIETSCLDYKCEFGYGGSLCQDCMIYENISFNKASDGVCIPCKSVKDAIVDICLKIIYMLLFYIVIIFTTISNMRILAEKTHFEKKDSFKMITIMNNTIYLKIFVNYLQIVSLSKGFELKWPSSLQNLFKTQGQVTEIAQNILAFDCFINNSFPVKGIYLKAILATLFPFVANIIIGLLWFTVKLIKKIPIKDALITTLVVANFIFQPSVIDVMSKILSCKEIDKNEFFLSVQLSFQCYTDEHIFYIEFLSLPALLIWCLFAPSLVFIILYIKRKKLTNKETISKFGFFYFGYKEKYYYWEIILMIRKILLIFTTVFFVSNNSLKALIAVLILGISFFGQKIISPFKTEELNQMELFSCFVSLSTMYLGYLNFAISDYTVRLILFILIISINGYFLIKWGFKIILINIGKFHITIKNILKRFRPQLLTEYKNFFKGKIKPFLIKNYMFTNKTLTSSSIKTHTTKLSISKLIKNNMNSSKRKLQSTLKSGEKRIF